MDQNEQPLPEGSPSEISSGSPSKSIRKVFISSFVGLIILIISLAGGFIYAEINQPPIIQNSEQNISQSIKASPTLLPSPPQELPVYPIESGYSVKTTNFTSPDGKYKVGEKQDSSYVLGLLDSKNSVIVENISLFNEKEIGYNTKIRCQCGISFKGWYDNDTFVILITNGGGESYEFLVSGITGKVDPESIRRTE